MAPRPRYYLDTNAVISVAEAVGPLPEAQRQFIEGMDAGRVDVVTSELTLAECLVKPMADRNAVAVEAYLTFLDGRPNLPVLPVTRDILIAAARLRAELGVKLPDAIHVATALAAGCTVFLTNDRGINAAAGLSLEWWDRFDTGPLQSK